jgi:hypothetical protein
LLNLKLVFSVRAVGLVGLFRVLGHIFCRAIRLLFGILFLLGHAQHYSRVAAVAVDWGGQLVVWRNVFDVLREANLVGVSPMPIFPTVAVTFLSRLVAA